VTPASCAHPAVEGPYRCGEWFGNLVVVLFLVTQVLDGAFTYLGISAFGLSEGNPLIAYYMTHAGVGPSLTVAKLTAAVCAIVLHLVGLHRTLAGLTLLYLSLAVLPWTYLIYFAH
jgi:Domain of unknown function (DUF5658)